MGRGIAVEFRRRWPAMFMAYRSECRERRFRPGHVFVWNAGKLTIFNLATQSRPGPNATLEYIEASLIHAVCIAEEREIPLIAMPRIGTGYGGLDWSAVHKQLAKIAARTSVVLAVYHLNRSPVNLREGS